MMIWVYALVFGLMVIFGGVVVWAMFWAAESGQFENLESGSRVIFHDDEPEGKRTDEFPEAKKEKSNLWQNKRKVC